MNDILHGKAVLFQGDSVTDGSRKRDESESLGEWGYPSLTAAAYKAFFPESDVRFRNRGVSGNRVRDLLDRYDNDFAALKPDVVSILIGVNELWQGWEPYKDGPTAPERFEREYETLLARLNADFPAAAILIMEPFLLTSKPDYAGFRGDLDAKIQIVRALAAKYADYYLPLDGIFAGLTGSGTAPAELAYDGVHPTAKGHGIIAYHWLKTIGAL